MLPKTPTLSVVPSDATIESGTRVSVSCVTSSTGSSITYNFFKDGKAVTSQSGGTYIMGSISNGDSGIYTCSVTINSVTSVASSNHYLIVVGESMVNVLSIVNM